MEEIESFALSCMRCGREMLDRQTFRERDVCLRCGFALGIPNGILAPEMKKSLTPVRNGKPHVVRDVSELVRDYIAPARKNVVLSETRVPKPVLVRKVGVKTKPATTYVSPVAIEIEGEEHLADEALEELKKIERLTPEETKVKPKKKVK